MIYTQSEEIKKIAKVAFPDYTGKKFRVDTSFPTCLDSYWQGGSRDYFVFVNLETLEALPVQSNHPFYEPNNPRKLNPSSIPSNVVLVERCIFSGRELYITVYTKPENITTYLPEKVEDLTQAEKIVLVATRSLIASFRVSSACKDTGLSLAGYEWALSSLQAKGLIMKNKALNDKGRNAIETLGLANANLWQMKLDKGQAVTA